MMKRFMSLAFASVLLVAAQTAIAQNMVTPRVTNSLGQTVPTQAVAPVDPAGNYVGPTSDIWSYAAPVSGITNSTAGVTIKAAVAGKRNYITSCQFSTETLSAQTQFVIRDGADGTVLYRIRFATNAIAPNSQLFLVPLRSSVNTLLEIATLSAVTGAVYINCQGFVGL